MTYGRRSSFRQWARLAMKVGLFLTNAKILSAVNRQIRDHGDDIGDVVHDSYDEASTRGRYAGAAIRGDSHWFGNATSFLGGISVGIGVGLLIAPVSGDEARAVIRKRATEMKERVSNYANSPRFQTRPQPTGTEGY